jgi:polar amino acid transport system permease protein
MFDIEIIQNYGGRLLNGFALTVEIVSVALLIGGLLAVPAAIARNSKRRVLSWAARSFIFFFRGTPLLAQAFLIYYGSGQFREALEAANFWWFFRDAYWCGVLALSLNTGAYTAEILRGAISAVPRGLIEFGMASGMNRWLQYRLVILPIAYRYALPAYGNEIILTIKGSAILSIITLSELTGQMRLAFSRTYALELFLYAGLLYLALTLSVAKIVSVLEKRLNRHKQDSASGVILGVGH